MSGIRANAVNGPVIFQRGEGKFMLEPGLRLDEGDFIHTGVDGLTELLLQPGNFLRVGSDTECQIFSDQHDKIRLKLSRGVISIEILERGGFSLYSPEQANELIRVITPNAEVFITRPGIYRINASTRDRTELISRDGEALINGQRVKEKRRGVAANGSVTTNEIDGRVEDGFDRWARERADKLVKANKSLKRDSWAKKAREGVNPVAVEAPEEEPNDNRGRVISAKPGGVNFVEDGVEFSHAGQWQQLTEKSQLSTGDSLRTGKHSFVELVMYPDMHLRLDGSSEMLFKELSNDSISLKLLRGSAILDVARFERKQVPHVTVGGPSRSVVLDDQGNYRIDVQPEGETITIREGKAIFNERSVDACHRITGDTIADCDKRRYDNFDFWSQHRGEGQIFNGRVTVAMVTQMIRVRRNRFRNTGFWFQQPGQTSYTFVPYTSLFFKSPYGGSYSTVLAPRSVVNRIFLGAGPTFRIGPQVERP
ncbi:MAG TPA: hypothetical protein VFI24_10955 [Pyrinomonadaceae bacterium]|nr:hypothetical protein [Pyrinomonadaceae bacterium]